jgi:hypothetical protein
MWFRQERWAQEGYFEGTNDANSFFYERRKRLSGTH